MTLGTFIRERRQDLGLTQEELAERVGESVRQSDISRLERDQITLPRRDRLEAIATALEVSTGELLVRTGWMEEGQRLGEDLSEATLAFAIPTQAQTRALQNLAALIDAVATVQQMITEASRVLEYAEGTIATMVEWLNPPAPMPGDIGLDAELPREDVNRERSGPLPLDSTT
jgi:transcriptional regulator with XRE-family HTH domain